MARESEPFRVAIVGRGFGERILLPALERDPRWSVVAICSRDWRSVLDDQELQAVAIAVPPEAQPEIALAAQRHRLAMLCEKPLATTLEAAERLVENAPLGVPAMVDLEFLEIPAWKETIERIRAGTIGSLREISVVWSIQPRPGATGASWKLELDRGGGALHSFASHCFYYLERFAGPVTRMAGSIYRMGDGTADTLDALLLEHHSGVVTTLRITTQATCGNEHRVELFGSTGKLLLVNDTRDYVNGFRLFDCGVEWETAQPRSADGRIDAVAAITSRLADWLESGQPQEPNLSDGLRVQRLIEAAKTADRRGTAVDV
jgi:predicted dehydrogenase